MYVEVCVGEGGGGQVILRVVSRGGFYVIAFSVGIR